MSRTRILYHLLRADFLERVRRYSFLITLAFAVYLGYAIGAGQIKLWVGGVRGLYNSAWVGTLVALVANFFLSLAGFYVVKNAVERDRQTGVGQILATTPMSKALYTLGKTASNFAVLLSMVAVLALAGVAAQLVAGEETRIEPWQLLGPLLLVALPVLALVAAIAVLFETVPLLRGGLGNVVWFFTWSAMMSLSAFTQGSWDFGGLYLIRNDVRREAEAVLGPIGDSFILGTMSGESQARVFRWDGIDWTAGDLLTRLLWLAAALGVALLAALLFDRFDPARGWSRPGRKKKEKKGVSGEALETEEGPGVLEPGVSAGGVSASGVSAPGVSPRVSTLGYPDDAPGGRGAGSPGAVRIAQGGNPGLGGNPGRTGLTPGPADISLTPLPASARSFGFLGLLKAELRLLLKGQRWWWYAVALGLIVAGLVAPDGGRRFPLLLAWIWPILLWSSLGNLEARHATSELVFSAAWPLRRQLPAAWAAGFLLALLTGIGVAVRFALAGNWPALGAWAVGAAFIPTLALALGTWSGTSRPFEAIYLVFWYIGPLQQIPQLDFMGAVPAAAKMGVPLAYLVGTVILGAVAVLGRKRRLAG